MTARPHHRSDLWAITSYFNPMGWCSRRENYRVFRARLNLPLVVVELAYGADFELRDDDAEIVVRRRGHDVLFQKERLLNLALPALPAHCRKVAWVDCDVVFAAADWAEQTSRLLDRCLLVQPYRDVIYLARDCAPRRTAPPLRIKPSFVSVLAEAPARPAMPAALACVRSGEEIASRFMPRTNSKGIAWAARREFLEAFGFYDACVVGNGDRAMVGAYFGCFEEVADSLRMNVRQKRHYLGWARPVFEAVRAEAGFVDGDVFHLWHGDLAARRWGARHLAFARFAFDPFADIALDSGGCWRWNSHKPAMHEYVRSYFVLRREDG